MNEVSRGNGFNVLFVATFFAGLALVMLRFA
jgi:hypothetical protein